MIAQISGNIESLCDNTLTLAVGGISYEVYIPTAVIKNFEGRLEKDSKISLFTYHYYQTDPSRSIPILIGFANRIEKDFFEKFITVSGVGPKAAVRALSQPMPDIAAAIDEGDLKYLKALPGIGEQRAKEIIAKLQGKMGRFGLMKITAGAGSSRPVTSKASDLENEAMEVLLQLEYKKDEAKEMLRKAFSRKPSVSTIEELLNEVYRQKKEL